MRNTAFVRTWAAILISFLWSDPSSAKTLTGQASVIDGDTLEIHGRRVRMAGIDAPESRQTCADASGKPYRCGQVAAFALADKIGQTVVTCEGKQQDRYKRLIAVCFSAGADLNAWMVQYGHAVAYRRYSKAYVHQEDVARQAKVGLWAGAFEMPWEWRHKR
jgi:endonuclease YncB( thermonuclease family)